MTVSPLAPDCFPDLPIVDGVRFASASAGVKYQDRDDVMLAVLQPGTSVAGVFTRSATRSAPVLDCQAKLGSDQSGGAGILVNSGNANAFTGSAGEGSVAQICGALAEALDLPKERIFTASTGVIGERLPHDNIIGTMSNLSSALSPEGIEQAANAIMTTDTFPKGASATVNINGKPVTIAGIAKGSGMIAPDMATMLVYIFTDALIEQPALQALLGALTDQTFNCITVDSDTSTSDSLMIAATGASGVDVTESAGFTQALHGLMLDLAHQVVRDGEGATKFVEVRVTGAASNEDAHKVGLAIANSPLVKTAIAGEDPNWGRIVMAVGKSGAQADRDRLTIRFGGITVAENGWVSPDYTEDAGAAYMKNESLVIGVDLGLAGGMGTIWTCDLTHGYISINADYRS
ncbi:bifunctional glutamate N-acetyltransferase/amino-acid acetyltransferase ArgJ [Octadecabacter sp. 1_MG-2023]|uniref:bifunctional glutamate N-acetyltransferase/amino-acid acetyltransferase ArgJ n=1 Tax=unclassified Octadecabacter TaxID=196158 RepID=UPI001C080AEA|nr:MULTISPECIES: bifunctional glutamate N-acetyltransferase/amino-acid acetyltransferase ArgJ [unclassified Octadecabacter]MBU2992268.1 bifunctional glutamate N-acetyltransferase/amino-acid acetyltransferase ArgJ [Octadecabacter sp. B2R22]MDO6734976.1 bifunctional glutamate N-acetyltransferase/amino-acid acetyltransferase ArgJ [Octadecabacter sp. 1_MG-2023]